jgi:hypothetical protein
MQTDALFYRKAWTASLMLVIPNAIANIAAQVVFAENNAI